MPSETIIEAATLLNPISDDSPSGVLPETDYSSNYYNCKALRSKAYEAERLDPTSENSDIIQLWGEVIEKGVATLEKECKDLDTAAFLTEALTRQFGFPGLRDGLNIIEGLIDNFWDTLYPPIEDGYDHFMRLRFISALSGSSQSDGTLMAPIRRIPITEFGGYTLSNYITAQDIETITNEEAKQSRIENTGYSINDIEASAAESRHQDGFYQTMLEDIKQCIALSESIGKKLDQFCTEDRDSAPSTKHTEQLLEKCIEAIKIIAKPVLDSAAKAAAEAEADAAILEPQQDNVEKSENSATNSVQQVSNSGSVTQISTTNQSQSLIQLANGPIQSRKAAFKQLKEIAQYFKKAEPHSPVSYLIEKAIKWGNMPLEALIGELISEPNAATRYRELTGVNELDEDGYESLDEQDEDAVATSETTSTSGSSNVRRRPRK